METDLHLDASQRFNIAKNLSHLMTLRKTTESKIAQELNIPLMTVRRLLSGETTDPRVFTLKMLADYFDVGIDDLIETNTDKAHTFIARSKPLFLPILNWEIANNIGNLDLKKWSEWTPVTVGKHERISPHAFALESKPSMYPRFQQGTLFIFDPDLTPTDGDLVLVNLGENNDVTLRELFIDPPEWQLQSVHQNSPTLKFSKEHHRIVAVVFLTLFYNRKMKPLSVESE